MNLNTTGKQIQDLILAGKDDEVLKRLYSSIFPKTKSYILKHGGSREEAEDLFQDCVLMVYTKCKSGQLSLVDNIGGFMMQIVKNRWINRTKQLHRQQSMPDLPEMPEEYGIIEWMQDAEKASTLQWMMDQIGEKCRELLWLSVFQKLSMEEIAQKLGFTNANAAKTNNYRCKEKLIQLLDKKPGLRSILKS